MKETKPEVMTHDGDPHRKNPVRAIREHCRECMGGTSATSCTSPRCELFPFRVGENPFRVARVMSETERQVAIARLQKARAKRGGSISQIESAS